ncbi:hypothetical protein C1646_753201 [Rhizophagus diaphanus]|nr:hypothetical protein C1646_753201 [Rhizophagus diaphanus] [Rhizophagus sp. MUCL 43196]
MSKSFNNTDTHSDNNVDDDEGIILKRLTDTHSDNNVDDDEDIILKRINCKISDMIAEVKATLNKFGIQTPISRRARTNFNTLKRRLTTLWRNFLTRDALGQNAHDKSGKIPNHGLHARMGRHLIRVNTGNDINFLTSLYNNEARDIVLWKTEILNEPENAITKLVLAEGNNLTKFTAEELNGKKIKPK